MWTSGPQVRVEIILVAVALVAGLGSLTVATVSKGWWISRINNHPAEDNSCRMLWLRKCGGGVIF